MRVLYLSQYFPPEIGATQTRAYEMARGLVRAGHRVTILTEFPNHPIGIIPPEYRGKLYTREEMDGIDVLRVWVKASPEKGFGGRMAFYLSYMVLAAVAGVLLARGRFDVVYSTSPPLFVGGAGLFISFMRRLPFVFEVRDLWPESAVELGQLNSPRALRLATRLEEACYARARKIVAVTQQMKERLCARGVPSAKIEVIPNGANTELFTPRPTPQALREKLGLRVEQCVVAYTGLHGLAHGLETVLGAAERLRAEPDIVFLFVGDGPRKEALVAQAAALGLRNVIFHPAVAETALPDYIAAADIGLDVRRKIGISHMTLPVKMFSYMACGRPVLLAIEGEGEQLLKKAQAGYVVPPEDAAALAERILFLRDNPAERERLAQNGRLFVQAHFSRQQLARQLEELLKQASRNL